MTPYLPFKSAEKALCVSRIGPWSKQQPTIVWFLAQHENTTKTSRETYNTYNHYKLA